MSILNMILSLFPVIGMGLGFAFADADGDGDGDGEGDKGKEGDKGGDGDKGGGESDWDKMTDAQKAEAIGKDPDKALAMLTAKRDANAQAKQYREANIEMKARLDKIDTDKKKADEEKLAKEGKHQEIIDQKDADNTKLKLSFTQRAKLNALQIEAISQGISNLMLVKLIDLSEVEIDDDFNVKNAKEVIEKFKVDQPDFFKEKEDEKTLPNNPKPGNRPKYIVPGDSLDGGKVLGSYFSKKTN